MEAGALHAMSCAVMHLQSKNGIVSPKKGLQFACLNPMFSLFSANNNDHNVNGLLKSEKRLEYLIILQEIKAEIRQKREGDSVKETRLSKPVWPIKNLCAKTNQQLW